MRALVRVGLLASVVAAFVVATTGAASADVSSGDAGGNTISALAEESGYRTPGGGPGCSYEAIDFASSLNNRGVYSAADGPPPPGGWSNYPDNLDLGSGSRGAIVEAEDMKFVLSFRDCAGAFTALWAVIATPPNLALGALDRVEDLVPDPDATFQPRDPVNDWLYVQVPTDFRFNPGWAAVTARAEAGAVWAEATANPTSLLFNSGDPADPTFTRTVVTPDGPVTVEYNSECGDPEPISAYNPNDPSDECSYVYLNSSSTAGGRFNYEFTIIWTVTFTGSAGGAPLPPATIVSTYSDPAGIEVAEARPFGQADG